MIDCTIPYRIHLLYYTMWQKTNSCCIYIMQILWKQFTKYSLDERYKFQDQYSTSTDTRKGRCQRECCQSSCSTYFVNCCLDNNLNFSFELATYYYWNHKTECSHNSTNFFLFYFSLKIHVIFLFYVVKKRKDIL